MWRYLNMFVLIGILLILLSLVGFVTGNRFLTEPGQPLNPQASLVYLGAGVLMVVNGVISIRQAEAARTQHKKAAQQPAAEEAPASPQPGR